MTPTLIAACTGASLTTAERFAEGLTLAMGAYAIDTPIRQAMFLPNVGVESGRLESTVENLNYRVEALISLFGRHRISIADAQKYGRIPGKQNANQEAIANCIYGGKWGLDQLGNERYGHGWKYRGRGLFQTTGLYNVRKVRDRLRLKFSNLKVPDFEVEPEKLSDPLWAALSAGDYWDMRKLGARADACHFDNVCDLLNLGKATEKFGDAHGFADREAIYKKARVALRIP